MQLLQAYPASQLSGPSVYVVLIVVAVILTLRIYRSMKGTKFSMFTLARLPAVYTILMLVSFASYYASPYLLEIVAGAAVSLVVGLLLGMRYASGAEFFEKEGRTHYKRAPYILIAWMAAFIARFAIEIVLPGMFLATVFVNMLLAFSTGLIIGEALHIYEKYKIHKGK
ncbi:MAG: hypothetical protein KGH69_01720 [Candidatus Micrarchaeota archaeon]|nr:hypothetical protein [Candidatus Micrarchaeota archaeon]